MFKFFAALVWLFLALYFFPFEQDNPRIEEEEICWIFKTTISKLVWYSANLICVINGWANIRNFTIPQTGVLAIVTIYCCTAIAVGMNVSEDGCYICGTIEDFFHNSCNKELEKFSYKFVKQFYSLHPENFYLTSDKLFICRFSYRDKTKMGYNRVDFRMGPIDYFRFVFFAKRFKEERHRKVCSKELRDAMIEMLEEDQRKIAEDKAMAEKEISKVKKDNEIIIARLKE